MKILAFFALLISTNVDPVPIGWDYPILRPRLGLVMTQDDLLPPPEPSREEQLAALMVKRHEGILLAIRLRSDGRDAAAEAIRDENAELSREIDRLLGEMMDDWCVAARKVSR